MSVCGTEPQPRLHELRQLPVVHADDVPAYHLGLLGECLQHGELLNALGPFLQGKNSEEIELRERSKKNKREGERRHKHEDTKTNKINLKLHAVCWKYIKITK